MRGVDCLLYKENPEPSQVEAPALLALKSAYDSSVYKYAPTSHTLICAYIYTFSSTLERLVFTLRAYPYAFHLRLGAVAPIAHQPAPLFQLYFNCCQVHSDKGHTYTSTYTFHAETCFAVGPTTATSFDFTFAVTFSCAQLWSCHKRKQTYDVIKSCAVMAQQHQQYLCLWLAPVRVAGK